MSNPSMVILVECPDAKGLVHSITSVLFEHQLNIIENREFVDLVRNRFFMRTEVEGQVGADSLRLALEKKLPEGSLVRVGSLMPKKIILMVTKEHHCLSDLLYRHYFNEINAKILAVISNYEDLRPYTEMFGIPFHVVSHEGLRREQHEEQVMEYLKRYDVDYIVLAKYMRILSPEMVAHYKHKMINIHHSFLPAFVGANPYRQAWERGVKIIGATAHFVTEDLDEGPIITQNIVPVDHHYGVSEMAKAGKEVERQVLADTLRLVFSDRVMVNGRKTVVF
jgi:formyltetrahydrofolate deformylase